MSLKPSFYAFSVRDRGEGKKSVWTRLGTVWAREKSGGYAIDLEALPVNFDGKIVLLPPRDDKASDSFDGEVA